MRELTPAGRPRTPCRACSCRERRRLSGDRGAKPRIPIRMTSPSWGGIYRNRSEGQGGAPTPRRSHGRPRLLVQSFALPERDHPRRSDGGLRIGGAGAFAWTAEVGCCRRDEPSPCDCRNSNPPPAPAFTRVRGHRTAAGVMSRGRFAAGSEASRASSSRREPRGRPEPLLGGGVVLEEAARGSTASTARASGATGGQTTRSPVARLHGTQSLLSRALSSRHPERADLAARLSNLTRRQPRTPPRFERAWDAEIARRVGASRDGRPRRSLERAIAEAREARDRARGAPLEHSRLDGRRPSGPRGRCAGRPRTRRLGDELAAEFRGRSPRGEDPGAARREGRALLPGPDRAGQPPPVPYRRRGLCEEGRACARDEVSPWRSRTTRSSTRMSSPRPRIVETASD